MKNFFLPIIFSFLFVGCQHQKKTNLTDRLTIPDLRDTTTLIIKEKNAHFVPVPRPLKRIKASDFIEDFKYIPLETVSRSLMGQYRSAYIHGNRIFIQDIESKRACIFDMDGKFINEIGKQGKGPGEFAELTSIAVDAFQNRLVAFDQFLAKLFYFTLDGDFLYTKTLPLRFSGEFEFIGSNLISFNISGNNNSERNPQLEGLIKYDIIYTDSALNVKGGVMENKKYNYPSYTALKYSSNQKRTACTSVYSTGFYEFEEGGLVCKYRFDYTEHDNVFNADEFCEMEEDKKPEYFYKTTRMLPPILFTDRFLWFRSRTKDLSDEFYTYYDNMTNKALSFVALGIEWDTELSFTSVLNAYQDYLIGYVSAEELIAMKEQWEKSNRKMNEKISEMIDNLKTDDNDVLVLFKLKPIR